MRLNGVGINLDGVGINLNGVGINLNGVGFNPNSPAFQTAQKERGSSFGGAPVTAKAPG